MPEFREYYNRDTNCDEFLADTSAPVPRHIFLNAHDAIEQAASEFAIDEPSKELYREVLKTELGYYDENQN